MNKIEKVMKDTEKELEKYPNIDVKISIFKPDKNMEHFYDKKDLENYTINTPFSVIIKYWENKDILNSSIFKLSDFMDKNDNLLKKDILKMILSDYELIAHLKWIETEMKKALNKLIEKKLIKNYKIWEKGLVDIISNNNKKINLDFWWIIWKNEDLWMEKMKTENDYIKFFMKIIQL